MKLKTFKYIILLLILPGMVFNVFAEENKSKSSLAKTTANTGNYRININNISTIFHSDGRSDIDGDAAFWYPKGSNKSPVYESGFLWIGKVDGKIMMNGSTFPSGMVPGKIGQNPEDARMYRVRPDWEEGNMDSELGDHEGTEAEIRERYKQDWLDWPATDGAPYEDVDGNGSYDPAVDIPGYPGADQTVYFMANAANAAKAQAFYGSPPMDVELHITIWGYKSTGPLGNMIFRRYEMFNKGDQDVEECYVSMWSDPDVGNAGDDFVGCDTLLSLGYAYNAFSNDAVYENNPPATGFDFFQGPMVEGEPTDTAKSAGMKYPGMKNLGMTAFFYFVNENNTPYSDPDLDDYNTGTLYFWNLVRGRIPQTGELFPIPDNAGGGQTNYPLSGDPVAGTGYLDGTIKEAKDRRYGQASGPFLLKAGDKQEIVVAQIAAGAKPGINNIQAVQLLKSYDQVAQLVYDNDFEVAKAPTAPKVEVTELHEEIILNWGEDKDLVAKTESHNQQEYKFQGYNVYQLPSISATKEEATLVATWDKVDGIKVILDKEFNPDAGMDLDVAVQKGNDNGVANYMILQKDYLTNEKLYDGTKYFFAVSAYAYNVEDWAIPKTLESPLIKVTCIPQTPKPGVRLEGTTNQGLEVTHEGPSDGSVAVEVIDPTKTTGLDYTLTFAKDDAGTYFWNLASTAGNVLSMQSQFAEGEKTTSASVAEGLKVTVVGPPFDFKAGFETDVNGEVLDSRVSVISPSLGTTGYILSHRDHASDSPSGDRTFDRFGFWKMDDLIIDFSEESLTWDYINETLHMADGVATKAPYSIYRVKFPSGEKVRLFAGYWDRDGSGTYNQATKDDGSYYFSDYGRPSYEAIYAWQGYDASGNEISYDPANEAQYISDNSLETSANTTWGGGTGEFHYPYVTATLMVMYRDDATLPIGNQIHITTNKPNSEVDTFTFTAPGTSTSSELAKEDVKEINVFPNPYYGANQQEVNKYQRFVTFNHLPNTATLRIFNLAGQSVRTLEKNDETQFMKWDLKNHEDLPVGSGVYVVYIDMPDLGTTKILKVAVIQEQQILDRF